MVCQLRPLVYSLGLNNPPRICLTPRKSRVKNLWCNKQGICRCKMAGAGIESFAIVPRSNATDYHNRNNFLANRSQVDCGSSALRLPRSSQACGNPLSNSYFCMWQSARRFFYSWQSALPRIATDRIPTWQKTEFQLLPFYIESPPVCSVISFCRATFKV
jgi:hypothetical protein